MAVSMRFLAKASQSFESIVSHAPSPKALRTPKTPKTPTSPFAMNPASPVSPLSRGLKFFPVAEEVEKRAKIPTQRSVHFADEQSGPTWVGNFSRLLGGRLQQSMTEASSNPINEVEAASATREAVRARLARQEDRGASEASKPMKAVFPTLLGHNTSKAAPMEAWTAVDQESCAQAAQKSFLQKLERRANRTMVDFVV